MGHPLLMPLCLSVCHERRSLRILTIPFAHMLYCCMFLEKWSLKDSLSVSQKDEFLWLLHSLIFPLETLSENSFCLLETSARSVLLLLIHVTCIPNTHGPSGAWELIWLFIRSILCRRRKPTGRVEFVDDNEYIPSWLLSPNLLAIRFHQIFLPLQSSLMEFSWLC